MPEPITLPEETARQIEQAGSVDYVVGIASHDNVATIGGVVQAAWRGLGEAFPGAKVAVVQADCGAHDGTMERAREAASGGLLIQSPVAVERVPRLAPTLGLRADGLRVAFTVAQRLGAKGCAIIDPDVTNASPDWVGRLLQPVAEGADYVSACYARHRFAGALTTSVVYPYMRAVYGKRIRYPVSGEFAASGRLLQRLLAADIWQTDTARLGIDVGVLIQALTGGFKLSQSALGVKTQAAADGLDLAGTLARVLDVLFVETERTVAVWQKVRGSEAVAIRGLNGAPAVDPVPMDAQRALESFRLGERNFREIWSPVLPPLALLELQKLSKLPDASFRFPDALWARTVYDFALAHHLRVMNRDHLLSAFVPLYSGWLGSWIGEVRDLSDQDVEARIEQLCLRYEAEKPYFISRWRSPDRFSP